jgi:hypothetical protein
MLRFPEGCGAMLVRRAPHPIAIVGAGTDADRAFDLIAGHAIDPAVVISLAATATTRGARDVRGDLPHLRARVYARVGAIDRSPNLRLGLG